MSIISNVGFMRRREMTGKRNPIAADLRSSKYKIRIVRAKKGKGSYSRKKKMVD